MKRRLTTIALMSLFCFSTRMPFSHAETEKDKKDEKVIGTDKTTGGEAPGDKQKMEDIKEGTRKLKERKQKR